MKGQGGFTVFVLQVQVPLHGSCAFFRTRRRCLWTCLLFCWHCCFSVFFPLFWDASSCSCLHDNTAVNSLVSTFAITQRASQRCMLHGATTSPKCHTRLVFTITNSPNGSALGSLQKNEEGPRAKVGTESPRLHHAPHALARANMPLRGTFPCLGAVADAFALGGAAIVLPNYSLLGGVWMAVLHAPGA